MKLSSGMSKFLTNKWVLNIISFLALFNVIGYLVSGNLNTVAYFVIIAVLLRFFSKNMTIVLGIPLIVVNLLAIRGNMLEGMENKNEITTKNEETNPITKPVKQISEEKKQKLIKNSSTQVSDSPDNAAQDKQGFETGRRKNRGYDIDYATTIEDAYDELNNILGSDGIQRLTSDTQNLMKQQMQLAEAMKGMTPVIQSIEPMVKNLQGMMGQMGEGKEGLGGLMDLAKKFSSQSNPVK